MSDLNSFLDDMNRLNWSRGQAQAEGLDALHRLADVAQDDTGQSRVIGLFLLGLYNGHAFPFNLIMLRNLDTDLHDDCLAVLRLDHQPKQEIHEYLPDGNQLMKQLIKRLIQED